MTAPSARKAEPLPRPTGPHAVGRTALDFVDESRVDPYAHDARAPRALVLWVWYPTESDTDSPRAEYLPTPWAPTAQFLGIDANGVHTHAVTDAPVGHSDARL